MVIYYNGVQQASTAGGGTLATTANTLRIGTKNGSGASGDYFLGMLDEVRIYNRGLSSSEVVTVMNAGGSGGPSLPAAPSALAATTLATNQIRLNWTDNATNESGFKIERKTGAGGTYAQIATIGANATSYTNTGLAANTQYYLSRAGDQCRRRLGLFGGSERDHVAVSTRGTFRTHGDAGFNQPDQSELDRQCEQRGRI